jgi:hypothetical protein
LSLGVISSDAGIARIEFRYGSVSEATLTPTYDPTPLLMVLGSQAWAGTLTTLRKRVADFETQTELAASTDFPPGE